VRAEMEMEMEIRCKRGAVGYIRGGGMPGKASRQAAVEGSWQEAPQLRRIWKVGG